jgi:hypothetical protein
LGRGVEKWALGKKGTYVHRLVILVDFLDTFHEFPADALALVFGAHEKVI